MNNKANTSVVNITNVSVEKTVNNTKPKFGDIIVYNIILHNNGSNPAFNIITKDILPMGLVYLRYDSPSMGDVTYDPVSRKIT